MSGPIPIWAFLPKRRGRRRRTVASMTMPTIEVPSCRRVHVVETGEGPPVVLLHGSNTSSASLAPVLERLAGVRAIAVDRPGFGRSEAVPVPRERFRDAAVRFVEDLLDELGLQAAALAGNSMGGTWGIWYALARPERVSRLVLLGSAPLLPGTRPPLPLRVIATPLIGDLLDRVVKPDRELLLRLMAAMGERDTIVRYPELIDSLVAGARDPQASAVNRAELRAVITPMGFRRSARLDAEALRRLQVPTLLIWGERDPVGGAEVARTVARLMPQARLELLPAGHVPYLGHPDRVARLLADFVRSR
jgi:pimeloyl-ACP methyl ester carboxylesterase